MAKNKDNDNSHYKLIGCLIILTIIIFIGTIFIAAIQCIPIVLPIVFLIAFFVNYILWCRTDKKHAKELKFNLTDYEKERYKSLITDLQFYIDKRESAKNAAVNEGIRVNQNGRLSARSYRGQDLQGAIDESTSFIKENKSELDVLSKLPRNRWKRARKHYSKSIAYGIAVLIWCGYLFIGADSFGENFSNYIANIGNTVDTGFSFIGDMWISVFDNDSAQIKTSDANEFEQNDSTREEINKINQKGKTQYNDFVRIFWESSIIMVIIYCILRVIGLIIFAIKYRKPPLVV